jgi:phage-related protein
VSYQAVFYRDALGRAPVNDFIATLDPRAQDSIDWMIDLLNGLTDENPELGYPYTSALKGTEYRAFRELRVHHGRRRYWIIFRRSGHLFVLLHMLEHKGDDIPKAAKDIAVARWEDFKQRMDAPLRRPPRAAGSDAP